MWIFLMWKESVEKEVKALICKFSLMCFRVKVILKIFIRWTMFDSKLLFFSHFFQMYKHERIDILETHLKGALEEGLSSNLENL